MRVLVTGASGFLGSHLAENLVREGHQVRALVRKTSSVGFLRSIGVERVTGSLETGEGLASAVAGVDAVVHGAAVVKARSREEFLDVNLGGTIRILEAAKAYRERIRRFVLVSSLAAHGFPDDGTPRRWDAEARPVTHYGESKLAAERAALRETDVLPITVVRPPAIYGPRDREMLTVFKLVRGRIIPLPASAQNRLSLVYAPDCAAAIVAALTRPHPSGRIYFVEDGCVYSQGDLVAHIGSALGVRAFGVRLPAPLVDAVAWGSEMWGRLRNEAVMLTRNKLNEIRHPHLVCSSTEIREELGWQSTIQLAEGARLTAAWYRVHGWL